MITVLIPVCVLLGIILCKRIPKIGGNVQAALILAGVLSLLLGGVFKPSDWCGALVDGVDRLAWVIFLSIFGSIYAETQVRLGTMETVMSALKAKFGKSLRRSFTGFVSSSCSIFSLIVFTAYLEAKSPALCPPIPSATIKRFGRFPTGSFDRMT